MTYMPDNLNTWIHVTDNNPVKIDDDVYFVKTRVFQKRLCVFIPIQAMEDMKLETESAYKLSMKSLATGKFFITHTMLKRNPIRTEQNRFPLYGSIPSNCGIERGCKFYAKIERADMDSWFKDKVAVLSKWFNSDEEKAPFEDDDTEGMI